MNLLFWCAFLGKMMILCFRPVLIHQTPVPLTQNMVLGDFSVHCSFVQAYTNRLEKVAVGEFAVVKVCYVHSSNQGHSRSMGQIIVWNRFK